MSETVDIIVREQGAEQAASNIEHVGDAAHHSSEQLHEMSEASEKLTQILEVLGLALTAEKVLSYADSYTQVINKLVQVTDSQHQLVHVEEELFEAAMKTRSSYEGTVALYSSLTRATKDLRLESSEVVGVVNTINQAIKLEGRSSEEASGALRMFAFQLNQGELAGRGLRTMLIQFPRMADALAAGLNVSRAALIQMGERGELDSRRVIDAFQRISPEVAKQFANVRSTVKEAFTDLEEAVMRQIGLFDQSTGASQLLVTALQFMEHHIVETMAVVGAATTFFTVFTTGLLATGGAANALWGILRAHPFLTIVSIVAAAVSIFSKLGDQIKLTSDGSINALGAVMGIVRQVGSWLEQLFTWLTTTDAGMKTLAATAATLAVVLITQFAGRALVMTIEGLAALSSAAVRAGAALVTLLFNPIGASIAVFVGGAVAVAAYTGTLDKLLEKAKQFGTNVTHSLTESMVEQSKKMKEASLESDQLAGRFGQNFDTVAGSAGKMGQGVAAGAKAAQDGLKNAFDDPNWGIKAYQKAWDDFEKAAEKDFDDLNKRVEKYAQEVQQSMSAVRNAMGQTVNVTDEWARRSGAYFNSISDSARGMGDSVSSSLKKTEDGYTQWATEAEQAADRVIRANEAASSSTSSAGPSSGGSGAGGSGGSFGFVDDVPKFLAYQAALQGKEFADIQSLMDQANSQSGAARASTLANAQLASVSYQNKWDSFTSGWGSGWQAKGLQGFAGGGEFTVGGNGGVDTQFVQFMATPGEKVSVETPGQQKRNQAPARATHIHMPITIMAADVSSFKRSEKQVMQTLLGKLGRAAASLNTK